MVGFNKSIAQEPHELNMVVDYLAVSLYILPPELEEQEEMY